MRKAPSDEVAVAERRMRERIRELRPRTPAQHIIECKSKKPNNYVLEILSLGNPIVNISRVLGCVSDWTC